MSTCRGWKERAHAIAGAALFALCFAASAPAQDWPRKPLTMIIPLPAGGATDAVMRLVAQEIAKTLGQPVVVENKTGATGRIGLDAIAKAPRDGYTFGVVTSGPLIAVPASSKNVPYDPIKDFTPLALLYELYATLLVHPAVPASTTPELVAYARANPGKLNYGSIGNGSVAHFITEVWQRSAGIDMVHIAYKGEPQALVDLLAGRIQLYVSPAPQLELVAQGKLKALATLGPQRTALQPDIPSIGELGYPEAVMTVLFGVSGPAELPAPIAERLSGAALQAVKTPAVSKRIADFGYIVRAEAPAEMLRTVQADLARYRRIAAEARISSD